jgi:hypothetical protein
MTTTLIAADLQPEEWTKLDMQADLAEMPAHEVSLALFISMVAPNWQRKAQGLHTWCGMAAITDGGPRHFDLKVTIT